ncbi:solute carrier family 35 member E2B isoform X2 [Diabrotica virgifera virgifera]|uniref:Sugar phosphate transporter domain-containing protein n=1 Tax=Diabrotica virgifera virgifera TaxID=50390 RepID=A0ABM5K9C6_DIAVI|nr:solute carrier family 35 member E2B isoform X2 [Diabrotica virgifera virgifera]
MDTHQLISSTTKEVESNGIKKEVPLEKHKHGLTSIRAIVFLLLWYFFSGCSLFLNKYILTYENGNPAILAACQMLMTATCGFIQLYFPCGMYKPTQRLSKPPGFYKHMVLVGSFRFFTVVLGLVSLNYVAVSFTETIKSSAPLFTVLISRCLLGEQTGLYVNLSLIPVMSGLALCSVNEVSFELTGFMAAMATNVTECVQNVYSKMLISGDKFKYTVANTAKRAFLIWLSVVMFGNPVTLLSGLGTITVIIGVLMYIKAQEYDNQDRLASNAGAVHRKVRAI